jgi:hypothetical protein
LVWQIPDAVCAVLSCWWWTESRLKHVERLTEINKLWNVATCWLYCANVLAMHGPTNVQFYELIRRIVCADKLYTLSSIRRLFCEVPRAAKKLQKCHTRPRGVAFTCFAIRTVLCQASQPARPNSSSRRTHTIGPGGRAVEGVGLRLSGIPCSNPVGGMDVCLLWVLCVVTYRCLRQPDPSSTEVLPRVYFSLSVIRCNNYTLHRQWVGRSGQTEKKRDKKERNCIPKPWHHISHISVKKLSGKRVWILLWILSVALCLSNAFRLLNVFP